MHLPRAGPEKQQQQLANLEVYDPVSGHTVQYANKSPQKTSRSPSSTTSNSNTAGFAFTASPPASPKRTLNAPSPNPSLHPNPNQRQQRRSLDLGRGYQQQRGHEDETRAFNRSTTEVLDAARRNEQLPPCNSPLQSPSGHVRRFVNPHTQAGS